MLCRIYWQMPIRRNSLPLLDENHPLPLGYQAYLKQKIVQTPGGTFLCTLCGSHQQYRNNLARHYKQKHGDLSLVYSCPTCDNAVFRMKEDFANHASSVHPDWKGVKPENFVISVDN
jgi:uncharacterized C2H2 Zn-finger protein